MSAFMCSSTAVVTAYIFVKLFVFSFVLAITYVFQVVDYICYVFEVCITVLCSDFSLMTALCTCLTKFMQKRLTLRKVGFLWFLE